MAASLVQIPPLKSAWEVLMLFMVPFGPGIPGGVLLARDRGLGWPVMTLLYFISDLVLALVFEPLMLMVVEAGKKSEKVKRFSDALKASTQKSIAGYGTRLSPMKLIAISFGVDPMTGRATAFAVGHGFITGWILAITGDMFFFALLMVSTLWLDGILGDGTKTTVIIMLAMFVVPAVIRRIREKRQKVSV